MPQHTIRGGNAEKRGPRWSAYPLYELDDLQAEAEREAIAQVTHQGGSYRGLGIYQDPWRYQGPPTPVPPKPKPKPKPKPSPGPPRVPPPPPIPPPDLVAYWTPERVERFRTTLRMLALILKSGRLVETETNVFHWSAEE